MKAGLSGYLVTRNAIELDYCFLEAIRSLIPVCDEVVVCDSNSTDGTLEALYGMAASEPKVRVIEYPFHPAVGDRQWYDRWLNSTRARLRYSSQLQLDADEVLGENDHALIRTAAELGECRMLRHVNFWRDAHHTTVWGDGMFARLGPSFLYMPSHGSVDKVDIREFAKRHPPIGELFHYSMLRHRKAFFEKQRFMLRTLEGTTDAVLEEAEKEGKDFMSYPHNKEVLPFTGQHPAVIIPWLKKRGWL